MAKIIFYCFLFLHYTLFVFGQPLRTITIDAEKARPLNLSVIAEKVTPIVLETSTSIVNGNILVTSEYLFITSPTSIVQYDLTGKYIRTIDCGDYINFNVTSDTIKKELYVPVGNTIKCYDYSGKLKKEYQLKNEMLYILYFNGYLWIQSYHYDQSENKNIYSISKINLSTGEIIPLSFTLEKNTMSSDFGRILPYNGDLIVSLGFDKALYKIQQDKVVPVVKWNINPASQLPKDEVILSTNGLTGNYMYINYRRDDQFFIYIENLKNGSLFNVSDLVDDVYRTSGKCKLYPLPQEGYFFYAKDQYDIKGNSIGNQPLKKGPVIFIIKTK